MSFRRSSSSHNVDLRGIAHFNPILDIDARVPRSCLSRPLVKSATLLSSSNVFELTVLRRDELKSEVEAIVIALEGTDVAGKERREIIALFVGFLSTWDVSEICQGTSEVGH